MQATLQPPSSPSSYLTCYMIYSMSFCVMVACFILFPKGSLASTAFPASAWKGRKVHPPCQGFLCTHGRAGGSRTLLRIRILLPFEPGRNSLRLLIGVRDDIRSVSPPHGKLRCGAVFNKALAKVVSKANTSSPLRKAYSATF